MKATAESLTLRIPHTVVAALLSLSEGLLTRMHDLLERNSEGQLSVHERAEVESVARQDGRVCTVPLFGRSSDRRSVGRREPGRNPSTQVYQLTEQVRRFGQP